MKTSALTGMTKDQRDLLLAVFSDCRESYDSRKDFDSDYKSLRAATLEELYHAWKGFNAHLASGNAFSVVPILSNWPRRNGTLTSQDVKRIRQVLGLYSRLEGHSETESALLAYRHRISAARGTVPECLRRIARDLISAWLGRAPTLLELQPAHGPGAVAEQYSQVQKLNPEYTFRQLDRFGGLKLLYLNDRHEAEEPRNITILKHPITRVVCVPKDFMKPRIISAEPCVMQFLQQGVARYMQAKLEMNCPYLNFRDQGVNASLSRDAGQVATLDMSDASDTVSRRHVRALFPADWADLLFALRSHFAKLPDGTLVPLRAFAPMGSALCFPVESVVFAALSVASYFVFSGKDSGDWRSRKYIRVYGDDIIVPVESGEFVMALLRESGFKPNVSKCCIQGQFRESCGAEWYDGDDVTVVRPRTLSPAYVNQDARAALNGMPMALHATALYNKGFMSAASMLAKLCTFPVAIGEGAGYHPKELPWPWPGATRWNPKYQRCEQQALLPVQVIRPSSLDARWSALFLGLATGWQSELVLTPRIIAKRKWVLAAPLAFR